VAKAETKIAWLPLRDGVDLIARRFECPPGDAKRWIVGKAQAGGVRARGVTWQNYAVSLLRDAWQGRVDWDLGLLSFLHGSVRVTVQKVMLDRESLIAVLPKGTEEAGATAVDGYVEFIVPSTAAEWARLPPDPDVVLPDAVQADIARAKAAHRKFRKSRRKLKLIRPKGSAGGPSLMEFDPMEILDKEVRERRDAAFSNLEKNRKRKSAFMLRRQRVVVAIVDRHRRAGVPFGTGPNSRMNKLVRKDLNGWAARYRREPLTPTAVRYILRQINGLVF
jgi:hypothetical protein